MRLACATVPHPVGSGQRLATFDVRTPVDAASQPVELVLHGVRKTRESLIFHFYLTGDDDRPVFAGQLYTYGEGRSGTAGPPARFAPMELWLDVTKAMRQLAGVRHVSVLLNIQDAHGKEHREEALTLESVELRVGELE